jgi:hypothetical protein
LLAPQTEEGAEEEAEGYSFCLLQVSSSDLLAGTATGQTTSVAIADFSGLIGVDATASYSLPIFQLLVV